MILLLQTKKLKHMGVKNLVQGHTAEKCQCQGSNPDSLAPGSMLFPTLLHPSHPWPGKKQPLYVNDEKPGSPSQPQPLIYPSILCLSLCLWRILLLVGKQSIGSVSVTETWPLPPVSETFLQFLFLGDKPPHTQQLKTAAVVYFAQESAARAKMTPLSSTWRLLGLPGLMPGKPLQMSHAHGWQVVPALVW